MKTALVIAGLILGITAERGRWTQRHHNVLISKASVWWLYPFLVFSSITENFTWAKLVQFWHLPLGAAILLSLGVVPALLSRRSKRLSVSQQGSYGFLYLMKNYVFLPLSLCFAIWGSETAAFYMLTTLGSECVFWTLAISCFDGKIQLRKLLTPPMLALFLAVLTIAIDSKPLWAFCHILNRGLSPLGLISIPTGMYLLGWYLSAALAESKGRLSDAATWLLSVHHTVLIPLMVWPVLISLQLHPDVNRPLFLLAIMPCAIAGVYMSELYGGDPKFAARAVTLSHLVSVVTIPFWFWVCPFLTGG